MVVFDGVIANVAGFDEAEETWRDEAEETRRDEAEETQRDMASEAAHCMSMGCRYNHEATYLVGLPLLGPPCGPFNPPLRLQPAKLSPHP